MRRWHRIRHAFGIYTVLTEHNIAALNVAVSRMIRDESKRGGRLWPGDLLPHDIVDRISRSPRFALGFTGFKPGVDASRMPMRMTQDEGLAGQFLTAVMPSLEMAFHGGRAEVFRVGDIEVMKFPHFYYANVPGGAGDGEYQVGDSFTLPTAHVRRIVIDMTGAEIVELLRDGMQRCAAAVLKGERQHEAEHAREIEKAREGQIGNHT